MKTIGVINYNEKLINHKELSYIQYNADNLNVPELTIGWNLVKLKHSEKNLDILNKEVSKNKYWEFSPIEDIVQYSNGLELFIKNLPNYFINNYKYINVDPFANDLFTLDTISNYFPINGSLYIYKNDVAYYLLGNTIYGFKLSIYEYVGQSVEDIVQLLVNKSKNSYLDDSTEYQKYYKLFPEFGTLKRAMVVFMF